MFLSKLTVPVAKRCALQSLTKLPKCLLSTTADKGKLCPKAPVATSVGAESRCEKQQQAAGKCPRMQPKADCQSTGSQNKDGCGRHAAEAFSRSLAKVRNEALTLQIFTRNSVNAIIGSMDLESASLFKAERSRAMQKLQTIVEKIEQISRMSVVCGAAKRKQCYAIHEQIFASLQVWECENTSGEQSVKRRLEELECTVKERTDTAVSIVRTCKGCVNPDNLMICVEASSHDAECILSMTNVHARNEIANIEQLKSQILQENASVIQQLMSDFDNAVADFEKELITCTAELTKCQK